MLKMTAAPHRAFAYAPCVLVCVANPMGCEELIAAGALLAREISAPLRVLSIQPRNAFQTQCGLALDSLFSTVRAVGGEMTVLYDNRRFEALVRYLESNPAHTVMLSGTGPQPRALAAYLQAAHPGTEVRQVTPALPASAG